jgi:hypothetical protein
MEGFADREGKQRKLSASRSATPKKLKFIWSTCQKRVTMQGFADRSGVAKKMTKVVWVL